MRDHVPIGTGRTRLMTKQAASGCGSTYHTHPRIQSHCSYYSGICYSTPEQFVCLILTTVYGVPLWIPLQTSNLETCWFPQTWKIIN